MEFFTTFDRAFARPETAKIAMEMLQAVAELEGIPKTATWSASVRGICIVVFAEW